MSRSFNQPTKGRAYRLCAIVVEENILYVQDFELSQENEARKWVDDPKYSSAALFGDDGTVIASRVDKIDGDMFSDILSGQMPRQLDIQFGH